MASQPGWLLNFSITRRLIAVFMLFAASMTAVAVYLSQVTAQKVGDIARLETALETKREVIAIQNSVRRYSAQLDARESVIASRDFRALQALKADIAASRAEVERRVRQLHSLEPSIDPAVFATRLDDLRAAHDAYLSDVVAADVVAAARAQQAIVQRQAAFESLIAADTVDTADTATDFDAILADLAGLSRNFSFATGLVITIMVLAAGGFLILIVLSVSRPLNRLFLAIDRLDTTDPGRFPRDSGPAEFQAIGRALDALSQRLAAQREAEKQLRESEARLRQFAEVSADEFWETDAEHRFTWVHARSQDLAADRAFALGRTHWEAAGANPDDDPMWRAHRDGLTAHQPFRGFEYAVVQNDEVRWWRASGTPTFEPDGAFVGYRGTSSDITEQRAVSERLRQSHSREAIGRLSGGIAHDFNNLLTVLKSNLDLLIKHAELPGPLVEMLSRCVRATDRGSRLTGQLLALGQRQTLNPHPVDLRAFLGDFAELVRRTIPSTIEVEVRTSQRLPHAHVDASALQDALLNLVINARDAMPEGGKLTLSARPGNRASAEAGERATCIDLLVTDTGGGIAPSLLAKVFDPFFTTKSVGEGSGLGLSMVRGFIEQTGGTIELLSTPGEGTTVKLQVPATLTEDATLRTPGAPALAASPGQGETILLVEDDEDVRSSLEATLMYLGYRVVGCHDASAALEVLESGDPPIFAVISDIVMPGELRGDRFAALVVERYPAIPVILMTGYAHEGVPEDPRLAEVPVLPKPLDSAELRAALLEAMRYSDRADNTDQDQPGRR